MNNVLYKKYGVRASGKQNLKTGKIDIRSLKLVKLVNYHPKFDSDYLESFITKIAKNWKNINAEDWLVLQQLT